MKLKLSKPRSEYFSPVKLTVCLLLIIQEQEEKTKRLLHENETLEKDVSLEQDKLTSMLLSLVSRENRYAESGIVSKKSQPVNNYWI